MISYSISPLPKNYFPNFPQLSPTNSNLSTTLFSRQNYFPNFFLLFPTIPNLSPTFFLPQLSLLLSTYPGSARFELLCNTLKEELCTLFLHHCSLNSARFKVFRNNLKHLTHLFCTDPLLISSTDRESLSSLLSSCQSSRAITPYSIITHHYHHFYLIR